jgi:hypothetical protein
MDGQVYIFKIQSIQKVFWPIYNFQNVVTLQPYSKIDTIIFFSHQIYTQYPIMTKWKPLFWKCCKFIKNEKQKYLIYISIQTLCYETRNSAQVHPVSIDHPWDVSTTWLESICGKFNWLDIIWKGTHLPIQGPTVDSACQSKNQAGGPRNWP